MMQAVEYAEGAGKDKPKAFTFDTVEEEINRLHEIRIRQTMVRGLRKLPV